MGIESLRKQLYLQYPNANKELQHPFLIVYKKIFNYLSQLKYNPQHPKYISFLQFQNVSMASHRNSNISGEPESWKAFFEGPLKGQLIMWCPCPPPLCKAFLHCRCSHYVLPHIWLLQAMTNKTAK